LKYFGCDEIFLNIRSAQIDRFLGMEMMRLRLLTFVPLLLTSTSGYAFANDAACAALKNQDSVPDLTIVSTKMITADPKQQLPSFCEVIAEIRPTAGSNIGVVLRLPEDWNGKFLGIGGGGFSGNVTLAGATPGLSKGYAVAGTDTGHPSSSITDGSFMVDKPGHVNPVQLADFGYRAIHLMTTDGKALVAKYYGRQQARAYFEGCSTGGRQGFSEVQRFPDDYDGVISGAPVYDLRVQTSGVFRLQAFRKDSDSLITYQQLDQIHAAVNEACDKADGVRDGIISDPLSCKWDPAALACRPGEEGPTCLTVKQVAAVRQSYDGTKSSTGEIAAWPLMRGSELAWGPRSIGGTPDNPLGQNYSLSVRYLMTFLYGDADHPWKTATADQITSDLNASPVAKAFQANNPDASSFIKRGGKWLMWHGLQDPGPSPVGTIEYFQAARKVTSQALSVSESDLGDKMRLFLAPGVYHCRGGPGPDQFDMLSAIDAWVDQGKAPASIVATKANSDLSRPLCPYPTAARYNGEGDTKSAQSFSCH
jgi:feruloyl esterase